MPPKPYTWKKVWILQPYEKMQSGLITALPRFICIILVRMGILNDMQKLAFERLLKALRSISRHQQPSDKLRFLGKTYIDFGIRNPRQYELMFILNHPMKGIELPESCDNFQHTFRFMQSTVRESIAKKTVIYTDPHTASLQLWSILHGLTCLYLSDRLAHYCGCDCKNPDPVYRAWELYIESISIKNNSKTDR